LRLSENLLYNHSDIIEGFFMFNRFLPPIHREGIPFVIGFALVAFILALFSNALGIIGGALTLCCYAFFRDPERVCPVGESLVLSPADGVITSIETVVGLSELEMQEEKYLKISIFLSVFNVHVNRSPCAGKIKKIWYYPGQFISATLDKSSHLNERQAFKVVTPDKKEIAFVQIAGLIARRIVRFVQEGDELLAGQRFGIIRFGSRMDVYLPKSTAPLIVEGQTVIGGETILADLSMKGKAREGEIR
jgi:phosphatidylserine decarboxylase